MISNGITKQTQLNAHGTQSQAILAKILALQFTNLVALDKLHNFSTPHLWSRCKRLPAT